MANKKNLDAWLKSGRYLPMFMRDFHCQKDVFRAMHEMIQDREDALVKRPSWIEGQCYVVDVFLWFMARRGYTLQKTHFKGDFRSIENDVKEAKIKRDAMCVLALKEML